ncbi:AglZ/HisF2 family acetamidino modification protein [Aeromonas veronii]|uniref:AglZ/HisF2 family acetamidino modification protein n=1 Tax=Aeromonas TaxID=642 RepID=UPI0013E040B6|nr:AglZ/HisF2 family acetamidino modification protein [Aeromonas veronii]MBL0637257.1 imidazole glycerol phosphate synthase subunit HisF [Aeromonas veronii]QIF43769.1 imidazole glycerol phosphate synthase cyclase subunit [Aeromonas veronii]
MLSPRIIPVLLVHEKGLVKTVKFKDPKYVGDPINAVKIFNEKEADELIVIDIDASIKGVEPDYKLIEKLATECRMPLCYGGGIKTVEQAQRILGLGVEKVALSSVVFKKPELITELAEHVGRQSVVVILDVKKRFLGAKYDCYSLNAKVNQKVCAFELAQKVEALGAGEIVINSIDNDGVMKGYDIDLITKIKSLVSVPVTAVGGAGSYDDIKTLLRNHPIIGAAAGSAFVFKGKYKAVLINYPTVVEKLNILSVTSDIMKKD